MFPGKDLVGHFETFLTSWVIIWIYSPPNNSGKGFKHVLLLVVTGILVGGRTQALIGYFKVINLGGVRRNIFYFHPYLGKWSILTSIYFRWFASKPPTRKSELFPPNAFEINHMYHSQRRLSPRPQPNGFPSFQAVGDGEKLETAIQRLLLTDASVEVTWKPMGRSRWCFQMGWKVAKNYPLVNWHRSKIVVPPNPSILILGGGQLNYFLFSSLFGEDSQFDEHIFEKSWSHQLD